MALDPVCGMTVDPARAAGHVDHEGTTYYFCSKGCVAKFSADPKKYLSGVREPMAAPSAPAVLQIGGLKRTLTAAPTTKHPAPRAPNVEARTASPEPGIRSPEPVEYVCPMDPEVLSDKP